VPFNLESLIKKYLKKSYKLRNEETHRSHRWGKGRHHAKSGEVDKKGSVGETAEKVTFGKMKPHDLVGVRFGGRYIK